MRGLKRDRLHGRHADPMNAGFRQTLCKGVGDTGLAMNDKKCGLWAQGGGEETDQLVSIGVGAQAVDGADLATDIVPAVEDAGAVLAILQATAKGVGRGPADEDQQVVGAFHAEFEVMKDAAELAGGAGGDDNAGAGDGVDRLALLHAGGEGDAGQAKEVFAGDHGGGLLVEILRKIFVNAADLHAHGAVDEDGNRRDFIFVDEFLDVPEDGLGTADGEGGDEKSAAVFHAELDGIEELLFDAIHGGVGFVAVGAFGEDQVGQDGDGGWIVEDGGVVSADIGGEQKGTGGGLARIGGGDIPLQEDIGRAKDMAGVVEGETDAFAQVDGAVVFHPFE